MAEEVKKRRERGTTRISSKHQVTIPVEVLRRAGLGVGDTMRVTAEPGRIVLEPVADFIARWSGSMPGIWEPGELDRLRDEWR